MADSSSPLSGVFTKKIVIPLILVAVYAVFGFFVAPKMIQSALVSNITGQLGRTAGVGEISVNPFALSLTVRDFKLHEKDGGLFAGFGELYVNFQLSSIFRRAFTFDEIRLLEPRGQVIVDKDGRFNFADLIPPQEEPAGSAAVEETAEKGSGLVSVLIFSLEVDKGQFTFRDLARPHPFEVTFSPLRFTLENFSTLKDRKNPYVFTATTGKGESLSWEGDFFVEPFRSEGRFALTGIKDRRLWQYIRHQVLFEITGGATDLSARYRVDTADDAFQFELMDGKLTIRDLDVAEKGDDRSLISIPFFSVEGFNLDLGKKKVSVDAVTSSDAKVEGWLTPDGTFNFQSLFSMEGFSDETGASSAAPEPAEDEGQPWHVSIKEVALNNYGAVLENRTLAKPVRISLAPINLRLKDLSNQKDSQFGIGLGVTIDKTGTLAVDGKVGMDPVAADLTVDLAKLDLTPLQSYLESVAQLVLVNGTADLKGKITYGGKGKRGPEMGFRGDFAANDFQLKDKAHAGDFLKWDAVSVNGISFDYAPNRLSISEIVARKLYSRVVIWQDGSVNVSDAFSSKEEAPSSDAIHLADQPVSAVKSEGDGPMPVTVDTVRIENCSLNFTDLSFKPGFTTGIQDLDGTIKGLTSESLGRADVMLAGKVDQYAPVKISGQINPLSQDAYTDVAVSFKNINLAAATPYSGKFVGYAIEKGKLSLDLKYKLSKNVLVGENKILLDQFTFGETTESPDAVSLPVKLAVSLLKDKNGVIDVDLPVRGDLNNPEFSYGRTLLKALTNLIVKITASPFAALGKLVGLDGEDLSFVAFEFGSTSLAPSETAKLDNLATALKDRPTLQLGIKGAADIQYDRLALAERELLREMKKVKQEEMRAAGKKVPDDPEALSIEEEDYSRLLIEVYEARFGEISREVTEGDQKTDEKEGEIAPALIAEARKRLIDSMPVDASTLQALAMERASGIKEHLIKQGGLSDKQVTMAEIEMADGTGKDNCHAPLTLTGT